MSHSKDLESAAPMGAHEAQGPPQDRAPAAFGLVVLLACCGVKVVLLVGLALSAGSVGVAGRNLDLAVLGVAAAIALTVFALRRRRRCEQACDLPRARRPTELQRRHEQIK